MSAQPLPIGASGMGIDNTKVTFFTLNTTLFGKQNAL